jgi:monoamine oxidase
MNGSFSRRHFLELIGAAGGSALAYQAAYGLGLAPDVPQLARPDLLALGRGSGRSVLILGAGISGLTAAYELSRKGYRVTVLDASHRAGGRNLTLRHGDLIDEVGDPRRCEFDPDPELFLNAGPARIAAHHSALLAYCREFGVALTPFVNENRNCWLQDDALFEGRRVRQRECAADSRGFIAELAAKAVKPESFDAPMTRADFERVLEYLRTFGALDADLKYLPGERAGLAAYDYALPLQFRKPLDKKALLTSPLLTFVTLFLEFNDQQPMMMEPVGGMDRIVAGFMDRVGNLVQTHSKVQSIILQDRRVKVVYSRAGQRTSVEADYCLNCIPMQLIAGIENNFPADYLAGMSAVQNGRLVKIAFQAKERFWEREQIYGGISWTAQDIQQMWYPNHGLLGRRGIVLGAYTFPFGEASNKFAAMPHAERLEVAIRQGEKLHPGYRGFVEHGVSVPWQRMNHFTGCLNLWDDDQRRQYFKRLQQPLGNHYLMGDQISYAPGWQEGAIHSAYHAIADIDRRVRAEPAARATA